MNKLILLTNAFPYGDWESYLETEIKYCDKFDNVKILSLQTRESMLSVKRDVGDAISSFPIKYLSNMSYLLRSYKALLDPNFYREIVKLFKQRRFSIKRFISLIVFLTRANHEYKQALKFIKKEDVDGAVFYSYRFEYQPYVAIKLREKFKVNNKIICRAHRYDLYEYRNKSEYIPLREYILENIDKVYACSKDGEEYLKNRFPNYSDKIDVSYLGTVDFGVKNYDYKSKKTIVSCSRTVEVKRIDLIIEALSKIGLENIRWIHYGDGPLFDQLKNLAENRLPEGFDYEFKGFIDNKDLLKKYKEEDYFMFLNVSSSEGLPVSIMEAISFSIPCMATDVGGTREILFNGKNGILLKEDISSDELAEEIKKFINLPDFVYEKYRVNAREIWEDKFSAENNYKEFVEMLGRCNHDR